jgi:hypothetical protein
MTRSATELEKALPPEEAPVRRRIIVFAFVMAAVGLAAGFAMLVFNPPDMEQERADALRGGDAEPVFALLVGTVIYGLTLTSALVGLLIAFALKKAWRSAMKRMVPFHGAAFMMMLIGMLGFDAIMELPKDGVLGWIKAVLFCGVEILGILALTIHVVREFRATTRGPGPSTPSDAEPLHQ